MKRCYRCCETKPVSEFQKRTDAKDGLQNRCAKCCNQDKYNWYHRNKAQALASTKRWQAANVERVRAAHRQLKYGITPEQTKFLLDAQGHKCALCPKPFLSTADFYVDHNHKTGKVRGLLCKGCNTGLGLFSDNPQNLIRAAGYLGVIA